jgi:predicted ATPase
MFTMTKNNFYVITGGPGGGKTTLLEELALRGYKVIPETARQIIKERLSKGLTPRPGPANFAHEIFNQDWKNFISNLHLSSLLFFDRSFIDSAWQIFDCDAKSYNKVKSIYLKNRFNKNVFITPPWKEIYCNDEERDQSFEQAIRVYHRLDKWYKAHDYNIIVLPKTSVEERINFILSCVTNY